MLIFSRPGIEALIALTSYAEQDETVTLTIDAAKLGFPQDYQLVNIETGETLPVQGNQLTFLLARHDLKEYRLLPTSCTG